MEHVGRPNSFFFSRFLAQHWGVPFSLVQLVLFGSFLVKGGAWGSWWPGIPCMFFLLCNRCHFGKSCGCCHSASRGANSWGCGYSGCRRKKWKWISGMKNREDIEFSLLRKPAGRLGKVVFRERSEYRGCGGELDEVALESTVGW